MVPIDRPLLFVIERFLRETGMAATRFGRDAVQDPRFVLDLRLGREPGNRVRCRAEHFMNIYRAVMADALGGAA
jgi:hypothetical protein